MPVDAPTSRRPPVLRLSSVLGTLIDEVITIADQLERLQRIR